ncbi:MAG: hypothetical protein KKG78_12680, partial [Alphaproteobacteria bacterium]|nr:hypothetical protein [Alphaproteobacteria bacterium]
VSVLPGRRWIGSGAWAPACAAADQLLSGNIEKSNDKSIFSRCCFFQHIVKTKGPGKPGPFFMLNP